MTLRYTFDTMAAAWEFALHWLLRRPRNYPHLMVAFSRGWQENGKAWLHLILEPATFIPAYNLHDEDL